MSPVSRSLRVRPAILAPAGAILALVGLLALPRVPSEDPSGPDPATRAAERVRALLDRLGADAGTGAPRPTIDAETASIPALGRDLFRPDAAALLRTAGEAPSARDGGAGDAAGTGHEEGGGAGDRFGARVGDHAPSPGFAPSGTDPRGTARLSGILVDGPARHAVIDGYVVAEGDTLVDGWVVRITATGVLLFVDDRFERLTPLEER